MQSELLYLGGSQFVCRYVFLCYATAALFVHRFQWFLLERGTSLVLFKFEESVPPLKVTNTWVFVSSILWSQFIFWQKTAFLRSKAVDLFMLLWRPRPWLQFTIRWLLMSQIHILSAVLMYVTNTKPNTKFAVVLKFNLTLVRNRNDPHNAIETDSETYMTKLKTYPSNGLTKSQVFVSIS